MTLHDIEVSEASQEVVESLSCGDGTKRLPTDLYFEFEAHADERGVLTVAQAVDDAYLPFTVERIFWITQVPADESRGMHAHRTCWEALVAASGSFKVKIDDGIHPPVVYQLDCPQKGILIPPMVWCELYDFTPSTVCLCLASGKYDKEGYLSNYADFLQAVRG